VPNEGQMVASKSREDESLQFCFKHTAVWVCVCDGDA